MTRRLLPFLILLLAGGVIGGVKPNARADEPVERPFGMESRSPWTTSRVKGSPDPPLPYVATRVFWDVEWKEPIYAEREPGTQNLMIIQKGGETEAPTRIGRIRDTPDVKEFTVLITSAARLVYGLTFHPQYEQNGFIYLFSNVNLDKTERVNRVTRYTVSREKDAEVLCDPDSRKLIIEWRSLGHDGGDLVFGRDGMLYITAGDGTSDSDQWLSAQDVTSLQGSVLRIDVDHPSGDRAYSIPTDNPFVDLPNAKGEVWAIGLRNPWRMSIDEQTGQIWVGNNGQDLWETAHLLGRGENYGWSVYEGSHAFYTQSRNRSRKACQSDI